MTPTDLDRIAAYQPTAVNQGTRGVRFVVLSTADRDALVALAREALELRGMREWIDVEHYNVTQRADTVLPDLAFTCVDAVDLADVLIAELTDVRTLAWNMAIQFVEREVVVDQAAEIVSGASFDCYELDDARALAWETGERLAQAWEER